MISGCRQLNGMDLGQVCYDSTEYATTEFDLERVCCSDSFQEHIISGGPGSNAVTRTYLGTVGSCTPSVLSSA